MRDLSVHVSVMAIGLMASAAVAGAATVGLVDIGYNVPTVLTNAGHTVIIDPPISDPFWVDVLYLGRSQAGLLGVELANVQNCLAAGGTVITELGSTELWFDGALASFAGTVTATFYVPSGSVVGGNTVTVTNPAAGIARGLPITWTSGDPIGVFRVYSGLDGAIATPIEVLGTGQGDLPVVRTASGGPGCAVMFFTDSGDFNDPVMPPD